MPSLPTRNSNKQWKHPLRFPIWGWTGWTTTNTIVLTPITPTTGLINVGINLDPSIPKSSSMAKPVELEKIE